MTLPIIYLYTDLEYQATNRLDDLMPIVQAQLDSESESARAERHGARSTHFALVPSPAQAHWFVLPSSWTAYVKHGQVNRAVAFAQQAAGYGKLVLTWSGGDPEYMIPYANAILVQEGLHKGFQQNIKFAFERPAFTEDYIQRYQGGVWRPYPKSARPLVGFCGLAAARFRSRLRFTIQNTVQWVLYQWGKASTVPPLHGYETDLRQKTLQQLDRDPCVDTHFIIRNQYKAGVAANQMAASTAHMEFVTNILSTMYTVCVRGGGNYSRRLYETLCCGRIPILVDTNSVLPFEEIIHWDDYIVRIPLSDVDRIGEIVCEFHSTVSDEEFVRRQKRCRDLWSQLLTPAGYYGNFHKYLSVTGCE